MSELLGRFVICRSRDQGVVCGYLKILLPGPDGLAMAELTEARQIHGWQGGVNTLFEAANQGFGVARISEPLENDFTMFGVCGVMPCTRKAEENLKQSRWNTSCESSRPRRPAKT